MSRPAESALESGGVFEQTGDKEAASQVFKENMLLAGSDAAQLALAFAPAGKIAGRVAKAAGKTGAGAAKIAIEGLLEGGEEGYQQASQMQATKEDTHSKWQQITNPTAEMKEAMAIGAIMGAGMGAVGVVNDMMVDIKKRTIESLPDNIMPEVAEKVMEHINEGMSPEQALDETLDEIAEVPEVKAVVEQITQEEAAKATEKIAAEVQVQSKTAKTTGTVYDKKGNPLEILDMPNPEFYIVQDQNGQARMIPVDEVVTQSPDIAPQAPEQIDAEKTPVNLPRDEAVQTEVMQTPIQEDNAQPQATQDEQEQVMPETQITEPGLTQDADTDEKVVSETAHGKEPPATKKISEIYNATIAKTKSRTGSALHGDLINTYAEVNDISKTKARKEWAALIADAAKNDTLPEGMELGQASINASQRDRIAELEYQGMNGFQSSSLKIKQVVKKDEAKKNIEEPLVEQETVIPESQDVSNAAVNNDAKIAVTDKSVRDNNQRAIIKDGIITVVNKSSRNKLGEYTISIKDWEATKNGPSANPNWNKRKIVEAKFKENFPDNYRDELPASQDALNNRIIDSEIRAIEKAFNEYQEKNTSDKNPTSEGASGASDIKMDNTTSASAQKTEEKLTAVDDFSIEKTKHTKTGKDLWVVRHEKLPTEEFKKLAARMKELGGSRYSNFTKGFNFYQDPTEKLQPKAEVKKGDTVYNDKGEELTVTNAGNKNTMRVQDKDGNQQVVKADEVKEKTEDKTDTSKTVTTLRKQASAMQNTIDAKRNPTISNQNPTPRRARIASGMAQEADMLEDIQTKTNAIAQAIEDGTLPESLKGVTKKTHVEELRRQAKGKNPRWGTTVHKEYIKELLEVTQKAKGVAELRKKLRKKLDYISANEYGVLIQSKADIEIVERIVKLAGDKLSKSYAQAIKESMSGFKRIIEMGITNLNELDQAVNDFKELTQDNGKPKAKTPEQEIKELERELIGTKIPGYFPTPKTIVEEMIERADIEPGMKVLEPSAGKGNIADAIKAAEPQAIIDVVEINSTLRNILEKKGYNIVGDDFLELTGDYDRIIMNPPFEKGQDIDHVHHAYSLLKQDGKVVAIMSEGPFFRNDKKSD